MKFLSTLSLRRATFIGQPLSVRINVSIHALLAESDRQPRAQADRPPPFLSTLSLRRATLSNNSRHYIYLRFLSTLSLRRATSVLWMVLNRLSFLSTLSLRRATIHYDNYNLHCVVSIHALLAESDNRYGRPIDVQLVFLSTLSLRRATVFFCYEVQAYACFYPRSPCGERQIPNQREIDQKSFYPRSPCGERPVFFIIFNACCTFLSTLSLRRATCFSVPNRLKVAVSIHALLAESDPLLMFWLFRLSWFLSTLSLRRATWGVRKAVGSLMGFYPRSPCGERPL